MIEGTKQKYPEKAKKRLNWLKRAEKARGLRFFLDEKSFYQDQKTKMNNDTWECHDPDEMPKVMYNKFPSKAMVSGFVSSKRDFIPLVSSLVASE